MNDLDVVLSDLRRRVDGIVSSVQKLCAADREMAEVLRPAVIFSRRLPAVLSQTTPDPGRARHLAQRTRRYLRCQAGSEFMALSSLAADVIQWCDGQ